MFAEFMGMTGSELKDFSIFVGGIVVLVLQYLNNRKMSNVQTDVRKVELATNSMKDQLVLKTEQEALARGGVQERQRADDKLEHTSNIVQAVHSTVKQDIEDVLEKQDEVLKKQEELPTETADKVVKEIKKDSPGGK